MDFSREIKAYAAKNALEFGKADSSKILPKLFQHGLQKEEIKEIMPQIQDIVKTINTLSPEQLNELLKEFGKYAIVAEKKVPGLSELPEPHKNAVFRLAPYPSGALHIGNAKTFVLNALYAEKYKGKTLLVMDDTIGSVEKQIDKDSYKLIEEGFSWLKIKYQKPILYKSKRIPIYYKYAKELIKKDKAYVCHCSIEELRENRAKARECSCRQFPPEIQLKRWEEMFKAKEGQATLRIKTSMMHPNPAFRDRVLFKISDREHPLVKHKYRVWPTLEMSWAIDDYLLKITHIIRGSDLLIETDMERYIWDIFKWKHPQVIHTGLVKIEGIENFMSKSKSQKEVRSGKLSGWDDPRTWSLQSLQRRGIQPEALKEFIKDMGLNKQDITAPIESLYSQNRRIIDATSDRYSFIENPLELKIKNPMKIKPILVKVHPDRKQTREIQVKDIFISHKDFKKFKGKEVRLLNLFNIKLGDKKPTAEITSIENKNIPKINWVSEYVKTNILLPNGEITKGIAEIAIKTLKKSEILQFERYGFVKFQNEQKGVYEFWLTHK